MGKNLKLLIALNFGVIVYFMSFKSMIVWPLFLPLFILTAVWYVTVFVVTEKMVRKVRGDEPFYFSKCQMINEKNEMVYGALAITENEIVFYKRQSLKGGVTIGWTTFTASIESYRLEKVDDYHPGVTLSVSGENHPVKICSKQIFKDEKAFRKALGWPEDAEDEKINIVSED